MTAGAQHVGVHHSFRHFTWGILLERPVNSTGQPSDFMFLNLQKLVCALAQGRSDPMTWHATAWRLVVITFAASRGTSTMDNTLCPKGVR